MRHGNDPTYAELVRLRQTPATPDAAPSAGGCPFAQTVPLGDAVSRRLLFPQLAGKPIAWMAAPDGKTRFEQTQAAVQAIARRMELPVDHENTSAIPAVYTYFGQFVFHDIVFSRVFGSPGQATPAEAYAGAGIPGQAAGSEEAVGPGFSLGNAVSVSVDLSGLYGRGPAVDAHLYDSASATDRVPCRFPIGLPNVADKTVSRPIDPLTDRARDLPRIDTSSPFLATNGRKSPFRPLIADPRNDDNLILSQLQCTLMQVHNRLVDWRIGQKGETPARAFDAVRDHLTRVYRQIVVADYLKRLLAPAVWAHFFGGEGFRGPGMARLGPLADLPVEFSFGASRFAHAMVRDGYRLNASFDGAKRGSQRDLMSFSSRRSGGDVPYPANWAVDWARLAEIGTGPVEHARRIGPFLSHEMATIDHTADFDGTPRSIGYMDLWRCYHLGLPSGQSVAAAVAAALQASDCVVPVLCENAMLPSAAFHERAGYQARKLTDALLAYPEFLKETPLSYYVLQEASVLGEDGNRLGPVGSYIVGATVAAALQIAEGEIAPWVDGGARLPETLADLLALADDRLVPDDRLGSIFEPQQPVESAARGFRRTGMTST